jgi:hypothetical protein
MREKKREKKLKRNQILEGSLNLHRPTLMG